jgi:hypothetical protein
MIRLVITNGGGCLAGRDGKGFVAGPGTCIAAPDRRDRWFAANGADTSLDNVSASTTGPVFRALAPPRTGRCFASAGTLGCFATAAGAGSITGASTRLLRDDAFIGARPVPALRPVFGASGRRVMPASSAIPFYRSQRNDLGRSDHASPVIKSQRNGVAHCIHPF